MSTQFKIFLTLLLSAILGVVSAVGIDFLYRDSLKLRAQTIAASLTGQEVTTALPGADSKREYLLLKVKLSNLKNINEDARYIQLVTRDPKGLVVVADSESPGSSNYAPQGSFSTLTSNLAVNEALDNPKPLIIERKLSDTDRRLSTFAPVLDQETGRTAALAGIDVPVDTYYSFLVIATIVPILLGLAISIIIVFLDKARARKLETLRFRSELVSIASHELRTPLTGIRWSEESMLKNGKLQEETVKTVEQMYESTLKLQESIEDILQLAGLQNQQLKHLQKLPTDITTMVKGIFSTQQLPASQHGIKLEFDRDWPQDLSIACDPVRMRRVFNNIISNAIKYTRPNTAVIVGYEKVDGSHVITIKDQGIGIPKKDIDRVFTGFYRSDNAIKHEANGTGMGLYLSRSVIEQHGGNMWLNSKLNKGTTVFIKLP
jgi:signal transduction histidine kinase